MSEEQVRQVAGLQIVATLQQLEALKGLNSSMVGLNKSILSISSSFVSLEASIASNFQILIGFQAAQSKLSFELRKTAANVGKFNSAMDTMGRTFQEAVFDSAIVASKVIADFASDLTGISSDMEDPLQALREMVIGVGGSKSKTPDKTSTKGTSQNLAVPAMGQASLNIISQKFSDISVKIKGEFGAAIDLMGRSVATFKNKVASAHPQLASLGNLAKGSLGAVAKPFIGMTKAMGKLGGKAVKEMGEGFKTMGYSMMTMTIVTQPLMSFFSAFLAPLSILSGIFGAVGGLLSQIFIPIVNVLASSIDTIIPIVEFMVAALMPFGEALAKLLVPIGAIVAKLMTALGPAFEQLIGLLVVLITPLTSVLTAITGWEGLWKGISVVLEWISTVIGWVVTGLQWFVELLEKVWNWLGKLNPATWF